MFIKIFLESYDSSKGHLHHQEVYLKSLLIWFVPSSSSSSSPRTNTLESDVLCSLWSFQNFSFPYVLFNIIVAVKHWWLLMRHTYLAKLQHDNVFNEMTYVQVESVYGVSLQLVHRSSSDPAQLSAVTYRGLLSPMHSGLAPAPLPAGAPLNTATTYHDRADLPHSYEQRNCCDSRLCQ